MDIAPRDEQDVTVENLHVRIRVARVIDVMRPVAADAAVEAPVGIYGTDPKLAAMAGPARHLPARYSLARILGDFFPTGEESGGETSFAINP